VTYLPPQPLDRTLLARQLEKLSNVSETLFIPFGARARLTTSHGPLDPPAKQLNELYGESFPKPPLNNSILAMMKVRTLKFDSLAHQYLHKGGTLIQLGAGLDTRFLRLTHCWQGLSALDIQGVEIDFPSVIELKRLLFPPSVNQHYIASSILETGWTAKVKALPGPYVFILEGVSMYLELSELQQLLSILQQNFENANLLFDFIHPFFARSTFLVPSVYATGARFKWGTRSVKKLIAQDPRWDFVGEHSLSGEFLAGAHLGVLGWQNWYGLADFRLP
jgi:O-methyltransferase involved in polyketide biosynthesis